MNLTARFSIIHLCPISTKSNDVKAETVMYISGVAVHNRTGFHHDIDIGDDFYIIHLLMLCKGIDLFERTLLQVAHKTLDVHATRVTFPLN